MTALVLLVAVLNRSEATGAEPAIDPAPGAVLHLVNGDFVRGKLLSSAKPAVLRWQPESFTAPLDFDVNHANAAYFPLPAELPRPRGEFCFELVGGDMLFGNLLSLGADEFEVEVPRLGRLHIRRNHVQRIHRWDDKQGLLYIGPHGLSDWTASPPTQAWRDDLGHVLTDQPGASLNGNFGIPAQATIEFEISWKKTPDFILALAVDSDEKTVREAFQIYPLERDLVVMRETERAADIAAVQALPTGAGRVHLQVFLDQETGRCLVVSPKGETLADLKVAPTRKQVLPGLRLINKRGDVRLEGLRIGRWNGTPPVDGAAESSRVHLADGSQNSGRLVGFDAASKAFLFRTDAGESKIAVDRIQSVVLPQADPPEPRALSVAYQDSTRISGELIEIDQAALRLNSPAVRNELRLPLDGLRSLIVVRHDPVAPKEFGRAGTLEMEGVRLRGRLVAGREETNAGSLVWHPDGSSTASPVRAGAAGRIVYREPPPPPPAAASTVAVQRQLVNPAGGLVNSARSVASRLPAKIVQKALFLRNGDTIPCELTGIDENGVSFKTPLSDATFVAHDKIKAAEMASDASNAIALTRTKLDRLLTLPRLQKDNPPAQIIRSRNGDFLRGRIVAMDDEKLTVEVRLETREIPRDRIARIIWLHADELADDEANARADDAAGPTRVQALRNDGNRLTFFPTECNGTALSGKSEVLGPCRVLLEQLDQLLFGSAIEQSAARLAYQQWKLQHAAEPKIASSDGESTGTESALVGKPAPEFELPMLGAGKFRLSEHRGKIVVLDFWATWCGPCLQTLPQVDQVARDFAGNEVRFIAVNLEEAPQPINSLFERHKLQLPVALDRDGAVAAKYRVTSIPQTFVIDRDGTVARHYFGGGKQLGEQLTETLRTLIGGDKTAENPP